MCPEDIYYKVMAQCFHKEANRRPSFTTIIKRLEGDIDYTEPANEVTLPQKKNDLSAGLDAAQKSATPRIRSKKSTGDNGK